MSETAPNDEPIRFRLKPEDAPSGDPQATAVELMELLRAVDADAHQLRDLFARWGSDPIAVARRAQGRSVELAEAAARALTTAESLVQAYRCAGLFSAHYRDSEVTRDR